MTDYGMHNFPLPLLDEPDKVMNEIEQEEKREINKKINNGRTSVSVSVNGMVSSTYKPTANFKLTQSKQELITQLKECNYRTPPIEIEHLLKELFKENTSKSGHWLYVAQHWTPKAINGVLSYMAKRQSDGWESIQNPAAYFTKAIKFRKKRKSLCVPMIPVNNNVAEEEKIFGTKAEEEKER